MMAHPPGRFTCGLCGAAVEAEKYCRRCGAAIPAGRASEDPNIGKVLLGRYELVELISSGGMGLVYRAVHHPLERSVAVKLVHPHLAANQGVSARFLAEAQITSRLNHPNIVSVHDFGRAPPHEGGDLVLVMELLSGESLSSVLKQEAPLRWSRMVDLTSQILKALHEAHFHGVVHRDVKPSNVIVERGRDGRERVKLIDFGVARSVQGSSITREGQIVGTSTYMSPEQTRPGPVGPSADLYAVGVMLFQMLTGQVPFRGGTELVVRSQHARAPRPDPRQVASRFVPDALAAICVKAMAIQPADRFASAEAFEEALRAAAFGIEDEPASEVVRRSAPIPGGPYDEALDDDPRDEPTRLDRRSVYPSSSSDGASGIPDTDSDAISGREDDLAWAASMLRGECTGGGFVVWGAAGVGRTTFLSAIVRKAAREGVRVIQVASRPYPAAELVCDGLRGLVLALLGKDPRDPALRGRAEALPTAVSWGLEALFAPRARWRKDNVEDLRACLVMTLRWAIAEVSRGLQASGLLIAIDDVDRWDPISRAVMAEILASSTPSRVLCVVTSTAAPEAFCPSPVQALLLPKLRRAVACARVGNRVADLLDSSLDEVEPLYVEQLTAYLAEAGEILPPARLVDLLEVRLLRLPSEARRVVQALAVLGAATEAELVSLLPELAAPYEVASALVGAGLVSETGTRLALSHSLVGEVARATAPRGVLAELHRLAATLPSVVAEGPELAAYHQLGVGGGPAAYDAVEQAVQVRIAYGDEQGAAALLAEGARAARTAFLEGQVAATAPWANFVARKGKLLLGLGQAARATALYSEILDALGPNDHLRVPLLVGLSETLFARDRADDALRTLNDAAVLADAMGDVDQADTLRDQIAQLSGAEPVETRRISSC